MTFTVVVCGVCKGLGGPVDADGALIDADFACGRCNGDGWHWSDRRPATRCPQTLASSSTVPPEQLACDRRLEVCPGCGRRAVDIGDVDTMARFRRLCAPPPFDLEDVKADVARLYADLVARRR